MVFVACLKPSMLPQKCFKKKLQHENVEHVNNFKSMVEQLIIASVTLSDDDSAMALLNTLLESYEGLVVSLSGQNVLILQIVIKLFLQE
jgi:hypothetical protein